MVRGGSPGVKRAAVMLAALVLSAVALTGTRALAVVTDSQVFINEFHYDNASTDVNEFVEIAGPAGTDLSGYQLVLYNGATTSTTNDVYTTRQLAGTITDQQNGFGTVSFDFPANGIQNGDPDGIALVGPNGALIEFLSYEGTFTAQGGPADGQTSTDVGVRETGTEPAPTPETVQSLQRTGNGNSSGDFTFVGPVANAEGQPNGQQFQAAPVEPPVERDGDVRIRDIQGRSQQTPFFDGDRTNDGVQNVPGVITAFRDFGFFMQDDQPDADDDTSEGIFVFTGGGQTPSEPANNGFAVGDRVLVDGNVDEFRPGGAPENLTVTQINTGGARLTAVTDSTTPAGVIAPTVLAASQADAPGVPAPTGVRTIPTGHIEDDTNGDIEDKAVTEGTASDTSDPNDFQPEDDAIDFFESLEGMLVRVNDPVVVGPSERRGFGEIPVLTNDGAGSEEDRTTGGGIEIDAVEDEPETGPASNEPTDTRRADYNPERVIFDDEVLKDEGAGRDTTPLPPVNVGDSFQNRQLNGVIDYSFGNFKAQLTTDPGQPNPTAREREEARDPEADELAIAEFSMENLSLEDPTADPSEAAETGIDGAKDEIVTALNLPDLVALTEVQDNDGDANTSETDADRTAQALIDAIEEESGVTYKYADVDPVDDQDGGEPGGNIRVAFLYREDRGLDFVERGNAGPLDEATVQNGTNGPQLNLNPVRVDPDNPAFEDSRKPLAGEFTYNGQKLIVVQNHFVSKGEDNALFGRFQPPVLFSQEQRNQQAQVVRGFVDEVLNEDPNARVIVLGDLNDFEFSRPLEILRGDAPTAQAQAAAPRNLENLVDTVPDADRYTFVFDGNSQVLDNMLISPSLQANTVNGGAEAGDYDIVHASAEFGDRRSDHDGQVGFFSIPEDDETDPPGPDNRKPVANNDAASTREDRPVRIAVLRNDRDPDGDTLRIQRFTRPDDGSVRRTSGNTLTYDPNRNFSGRDSFTYTVSDGEGGTDTATVTIRVQPDRSDDGNNNNNNNNGGGGGGNGSGGNGNNDGCDTGNGGAQAGGGASANDRCAQAGGTIARR